MSEKNNFNICYLDISPSFGHRVCFRMIIIMFTIG